MNTQQRKPVRRAFTGLVGLPPEPDEAVVAPTHTPTSAPEPPVSEPAPAPAPPPSKPAVSERLASLAYRPPRDQITGKVIEGSRPEEHAAHLILEAIRVAPAPSRSHKVPVSPRFPSMRQTLML